VSRNIRAHSIHAVQLVAAGFIRRAAAAAMLDYHCFSSPSLHLDEAVCPQRIAAFTKKPFGFTSKAQLPLVAEAPESRHVKSVAKTLSIYM
jgi:hypothetical protein